VIQDFLTAGVFTYLLVFARVGSAIMALPGFGDAYVAPRLRLGIALAVSAAAAPVAAPLLPAMPEAPVALFLLLGGEVVIGVFLGLLARLLMSGLQVAGMTIAFQTSLANAFSTDPVSAQQGALAGTFLTVTGLLVVFATDLHHVMLRAVVESYVLFEPGVMPPVGDFSEAVARTVALSFVLGLKISAPFIAVGLLFSLGIGVLARLMPQVQVFFIAMPLQIALGFIVLGLTLSAAMVVLTDSLGELFGNMLAAG
jgi:flagellar biosynthetic protein FliR